MTRGLLPRPQGGRLPQVQLAETEDRIARGRRFDNGNVRALNTRVGAFPSALIPSAGRLVLLFGSS